MGKTTAETIRELTKTHLETDNGLLFGQCVTAVGWIGGTVPDCKNIVDISMTDVAASGFAVGAALKGRRPIFVMRYQGFIWYNCSSLINYAARSKQVWGVPCPIFIRSLAMEGNGVGHTASSSLHSIFMHPPGMHVAAPMTPVEYRQIWNHFKEHDDPIYVSEHRRSFSLSDEMPNEYHSNSKITVIAISAARLNLLEAKKLVAQQGVVIDVEHLVWIKPFQVSDNLIKSLTSTKLGLVIDTDFEIAGSSQSIAYELMHKAKVPVYAMGLEDRVCGVAKAKENITPSPEKIAKKILHLVRAHSDLNS